MANTSRPDKLILATSNREKFENAAIWQWLADRMLSPPEGLSTFSNSRINQKNTRMRRYFSIAEIHRKKNRSSGLVVALILWNRT